MAKRGAGGKEKEAIVSPVVNPRFHSGVRTSPLWSVTLVFQEMMWY